jgi:hypothetical protein
MSCNLNRQNLLLFTSDNILMLFKVQKKNIKQIKDETYAIND